MLGFDLASLDGETKCSVADANVLGSLAQVHPSFRFAAVRLVTRDFIIGSQRDDAFSCPIFPRPVCKPERFSAAAIQSSEQTRASILAASTISLDVWAPFWPRLRRGKRNSVCAPPFQ